MKTSLETRTGNKWTSREQFFSLAGKYDLIPIMIEMDKGEETPLSIYRKLGTGNTHSFLLESGDHLGTGGRYSFIGTNPERLFIVRPDGCEIIGPDGNHIGFSPSPGGMSRAVRSYLECNRPPKIDDFPPFAGGVVGYFGYGMVEEWEELFHGSERKLRPSCHPDALLMGFVTMIALDHKRDSIFLIHNIRIPHEAERSTLEKLYSEGMDLLNSLAHSLSHEIREPVFSDPSFLNPMLSNTSRETFLEMVRRGREHIIAGDICQVVLSQRFSARTNLPSLEIYQALKETNPSPYLFFLDFPELEIIGSSPEVLVKMQDGLIITRPLAGTRPRGASDEEDLQLSKELLADEKERAEHLMLVDLARNDLGRVCRTGTVTVTELMGLELYSRVMHLVSQVEGEKESDKDALDVLEAAFPAGTVSGAPKIRAMEIIEELEPEARGPYAGAAGYIGFDGDLDTCIVIRTIIRKGHMVSVQAGAGIVYDSVPEKEYEETRNKASALLKALETTLKRRNSG